jgi:hypothetical protein
MDTGITTGNINDPANGDFSISFWFNADAIDNGRLFSSGGDQTRVGAGIYLLTGTNLIEPRVRYGSLKYTPTGYAITSGTLNHVVMTWDLSATELKLYLNGTEVISTTTSAADTL